MSNSQHSGHAAHSLWSYVLCPHNTVVPLLTFPTSSAFSKPPHLSLPVPHLLRYCRENREGLIKSTGLNESSPAGLLPYISCGILRESLPLVGPVLYRAGKTMQE
jgi:hypothetical protein